MKLKRYIYTCIAILLLITTILGTLFFFNFFQGWVKIKNGKITTNILPEHLYSSPYIPKLNFECSKISKDNNIKICILGKPLNLTNQVYLKSQRYYIPIDKISHYLNFKFKINDSSMEIDNITIDKNNNSFKFGDKTLYLRGKILTIDSIPYLSISDIEKIFNLTACFYYNDNIINFVPKLKSSYICDKSLNGPCALLRLEDFGASPYITDEKNIMKMKVIGNFLEENNIKFHVAWVPRYVCPEKSIDNDLLYSNNLQNVAFINIIDNLIFQGASIGLHGYTHQFGNEESFSGTEFSKECNNDLESTKSIIEKAIDTASALNIPLDFFESPHYDATKEQLDIASRYFQYIYQPYSMFSFTTLKIIKNTVYIPTPLGYVKDLNTKPIIKRLINPLPYELSSFYYHPTIEFDFIDITYSDKNLSINYSKISPLHEIIYTLKSHGYVTSYVKDFNR